MTKINDVAPVEETTVEEDTMPDFPEVDPEELERARREAEDALLAPARAMRDRINNNEELLAQTLYEVTLLQFGITEV